MKQGVSSNVHFMEEDKDHSLSDAKIEYEDKNEDYKADYHDNTNGKLSSYPV